MRSIILSRTVTQLLCALAFASAANAQLVNYGKVGEIKDPDGKTNGHWIEFPDEVFSGDLSIIKNQYRCSPQNSGSGGHAGFVTNANQMITMGIVKHKRGVVSEISGVTAGYHLIETEIVKSRQDFHLWQYYPKFQMEALEAERQSQTDGSTTRQTMESGSFPYMKLKEATASAETLPPRPGDIAASTPTAGQIASKQARPGDIAHQERSIIPDLVTPRKLEPPEPTQGEKARDQALPGHAVPLRAGEMIGKPGIISFTIRYDQNQRIQSLTYRDGNKLTQHFGPQDPRLRQAIQSFRLPPQILKQIATFARCCENDSARECAMQYSPASQAAIPPMNQLEPRVKPSSGEVSPNKTSSPEQREWRGIEGGVIWSPMTNWGQSTNPSPSTPTRKQNQTK